MKKHTLKQIVKCIESINESRSEWLLRAFTGAGKDLKRISSCPTCSARHVGLQIKRDFQIPYNAISQLVLDEKNSEIRKMEYDVSGKVKRVLDGADQEITAFAYDDRGFRILKRTGAREEWYVRDASGNILSIYHRDTTANSLAQIELPIYGSGKIGNAFRQPDHLNYNYELTDHLGNVRATFSNVHTLAVASMEPDNNAWEEQYFDNLSTRHSDPLLAQESYYSARLRPTTPVGPTITLEVKQGATIHLSVGGRYVIPQGGFNPANLTGGIGNLLNGSFDAGVVGEAGMPAPANIIGDALALLGAVSLEDEAAPKAYLQYILFDENWSVIDSDEVGIPSGASTQYMQMELPDIPVANDGYLYAYVVNESEIDVHFDNLTVSVLGLNVLSTRNYYPYGSVAYEWKNPEFDDRYRWQYQGQFAERDTITGWNHFEARQWDSKIAKWISMDPARQYSSGYTGMGNDPINGVDPDGRFKTRFGAFLYQMFSGTPGEILKLNSREFGIMPKPIELNGAAWYEPITSWNMAMDFEINSEINIGVGIGEHLSSLQGFDFSLAQFTLVNWKGNFTVDLDKGFSWNGQKGGQWTNIFRDDVIVRQFISGDVPMYGASLSRTINVSSEYKVNEDHLEVHGGLPFFGIQLDRNMNNREYTPSISGSAGGRLIIGGDASYNMTFRKTN